MVYSLGVCTHPGVASRHGLLQAQVAPTHGLHPGTGCIQVLVSSRHVLHPGTGCMSRNVLKTLQVHGDGCHTHGRFNSHKVKCSEFLKFKS